MSVVLVRVDDRLIHGQVVVGWVEALRIQRIVLVDDEIRGNPWEQELHALGVPAGLDVAFASVDEAARAFADWDAAPERTIVLVGDVETVARLSEGTAAIRRVNLGGLHDGEARSQRLAFVYLSDREAARLRALAAQGVEVSAQAVPTGRAVPLEDLL